MKKSISLILVIVLFATLFIACSSNGGIQDGAYVTDDYDNADLVTLTFKGDKMIESWISSRGELYTRECKYSYKNNKITYWDIEDPQSKVTLDCDYSHDGNFLVLYLGPLGRESPNPVTIVYTRERH